MTLLNWVLGGLVVGVGAMSIYNGTRLAEMQEQVVASETIIAAISQDLEELESEQQLQTKKVSAIGEPDDIARVIVEEEFSGLVAAVAQNLMLDPEKVAKLTGPEGPSPDTDALVVEFLDGGIAEKVANLIWEDRYKELAVMPEVLASVAQEVYRIYGDELRGKDGASAEPDVVARALALDPEFQLLLSLELAE
ncbi:MULTISPECIES: hypothetical protein [unclassified Roseovarius]|uniref:hypothetical protein n=1 Tax=unclassified Roseovarius TaxID=2614913 RepID=UPI00273D0223|nr:MULTISPECIES: hypothetical protein [unclassified Roseovarius]